MTNRANSDILSNVVARTANTLNGTTTAILENDTEKVILNKEKMMQSAGRCDDASYSQILKELNALTK